MLDYFSFLFIWKGTFFFALFFFAFLTPPPGSRCFSIVHYGKPDISTIPIIRRCFTAYSFWIVCGISKQREKRNYSRYSLPTR
ncbi:hypothetical protein GGR50DRAFT_638300 [Xylaria sp. CBS 124048]|nr:hypothetical protein GGR50DRAFT_638300 [Xylaria sp. CBS 124048]